MLGTQLATYRSLAATPFYLLGLVLLLLSSVTHAQLDTSYVRMDEYLKHHPDQQKIITAFSEQVRNGSKVLSQPQNKAVRIAVIYPALQSSDYWRRSVLSFEARLKELSIQYEIKPYYSRPSVDVKLQSQQLSQALSWQPDYLVFTLDALRHRRMIERVLSRGKPKLILQNITTPLRQWSTHRPFFYVGFDHASGTNMLADYMLRKNNTRGNYLLLYHSRGYVSAMRGDTFALHAAHYPNIKQVASYYTDGNKKRAHDAVIQTLSTHDDLDFIFASSTDAALGAIDALKETGNLSNVMVNGWGGGAAELEALSRGELDVTVMRINDDNGVAMAEAIKLDLQGKAEKVPHIYSGDIKLIHRDSNTQYIQTLKARAFRYSGQ